jgi:hypothetical protein
MRAIFKTPRNTSPKIPSHSPGGAYLRARTKVGHTDSQASVLSAQSCGFCSREYARAVKAKADFFAIASDYTSLRRVGRQQAGLCPFHSERHPSFYVDVERKVWKCFGCNEGGDLFAFVMRAEHCNFVRAVHIVAGFSSGSGSTERISQAPRVARAESFFEAASRIVSSLPAPGFIPSCPRCGVLMDFRAYRGNRFGGAYFCSSCSVYFGPRELREWLKAARGAVCQWCGASGVAVEMHHVLKKVDPFDPAWIVLFCRGCRENVRKLLAIQWRVFKAGEARQGANEVSPHPSIASPQRRRSVPHLPLLLEETE